MITQAKLAQGEGVGRFEAKDVEELDFRAVELLGLEAGLAAIEMTGDFGAARTAAQKENCAQQQRANRRDAEARRELGDGFHGVG